MTSIMYEFCQLNLANTFHEVKAKARQSCAAAVICTGITVLISLDGIPSVDG